MQRKAAFSVAELFGSFVVYFNLVIAIQQEKVHVIYILCSWLYNYVLYYNIVIVMIMNLFTPLQSFILHRKHSTDL